MHYVNNNDFLQAIKDYKLKVQECASNGDDKPRVPNYIGECILKIANRLSLRPNFINYTYRDEMISDGIENALASVDNFDSDKYSNPFAYFTQIIYYAFLRRIHKEKKQTLIKSKIIMNTGIDQYDFQGHDEDETYVNVYLDFMQKNGLCAEVIEKEETRLKKKANKKEIIEDTDGVDIDD